ncbi:MAG: TraB/GumN family protein [Sphingomonas sp.]|nr:TraB/GumN family protein [Sphingomonas sp.]
MLALSSCDKPLFAPAPRDAHPALWVVRDADTTIYLFGTVHVLEPGIRWLNGDVRKAFDASDQLVLEITGVSGAQMSRIVATLALDKGPRLSQRFPPAELAKIRAAIEQGGGNPEITDRLAPWYLALNLSVEALDRARLKPAAGVESVLTGDAGAHGKPVAGLETAEQQFGYFAGLSQPAQDALLVRTVDRIPQLPADARAAAEAWSRGDADKLGALVNAELKDSPELAEKLLHARNRRWADWIKARMATPGRIFVAVGAGHLAGAGSLQQELAARGFKVTRIQ